MRMLIGWNFFLSSPKKENKKRYIVEQTSFVFIITVNVLFPRLVTLGFDKDMGLISGEASAASGFFKAVMVPWQGLY